MLLCFGLALRQNDVEFHKIHCKENPFPKDLVCEINLHFILITP